MIVSIENAEHDNRGSGWSEYSLGKNNERQQARLILGDTEFGDSICESLNYRSGSYVRFVISFSSNDNVTPVQGRKIVKEWFKEYMHGFEENEYHLDIVEHQDTKYLHYHARIPKINLVTKTQLKPYYHKSDLDYKIAVNEYIANKYDLTLGIDKKRLIMTQQERDKRIKKWREKNGQKSFNLSNKKNRAIAEEGISDLISELNIQGLVNNLDDVKAELEALDFEIVNEGYDKGRGFHYITIQQGDSKLRLKGEIYAKEFYRYSRENRSKAISDNRSIESRNKDARGNRTNIIETLRKEREKRLTWIDKQYGSARQRAFQRLEEIKRKPTTIPYKIKEDVSNISTSYNTANRHNFRSVRNNLYDKRQNPYRPKQSTGDNKQKRKAYNLVQTHDRRTSKGVKDDRTRAEVIRRIRNFRNAKRARSEKLRKKLEIDFNKFNRVIPVFSQRDIAGIQSRTASIDIIVKGIREAANRNYQAIEEAIISRTNERSIRQDFNTIILRVRTGFSQIYDRIKQTFDRRTEDLIVGVTNVAKKKRLFDKGKKKVLSHLRQKEIKRVPRR